MEIRDKEQLRKFAEDKFKENGFKNHDWANFLSGFLIGVEYAVDAMVEKREKADKERETNGN